MKLQATSKIGLAMMLMTSAMIALPSVAAEEEPPSDHSWTCTVGVYVCTCTAGNEDGAYRYCDGGSYVGGKQCSKGYGVDRNIYVGTSCKAPSTIADELLQINGDETN